MDIIWNEEDKQYITVPDGDIATHKQIHDFYNKKNIANVSWVKTITMTHSERMVY